MTPDFLVTENPTPDDRRAILSLLQDYNHRQATPANPLPLAILVPGPDGTVRGGLYATSVYDWLVVELVFLPEDMRGQGIGSSLLARAEEVARARGCVGVWLDTFSFQARGFYERLGYQVFGAVEDHPVGAARYFLKKTLD